MGIDEKEKDFNFIWCTFPTELMIEKRLLSFVLY